MTKTWLTGLLIALFMAVAAQPSEAQAARVPPNCYGKTSRGETYVLQFGPATVGGPNVWLCTAIASPVPIPAAPTTCIAARWNGTGWDCPATNYLVAE